MVSGGLETVLIGDPFDGVSHAVFWVRVLALGDGSGFISLGSDLLLDSALADGDAVLGLVAERVDLFLCVVVLGLFQDEDGFALLGSSGGNSQEDGDQDHLIDNNRNSLDGSSIEMKSNGV